MFRFTLAQYFMPVLEPLVIERVFHPMWSQCSCCRVSPEIKIETLDLQVMTNGFLKVRKEGTFSIGFPITWHLLFGWLFDHSLTLVDRACKKIYYVKILLCLAVTNKEV